MRTPTWPTTGLRRTSKSTGERSPRLAASPSRCAIRTTSAMTPFSDCWTKSIAWRSAGFARRHERVVSVQDLVMRDVRVRVEETIAVEVEVSGPIHVRAGILSDGFLRIPERDQQKADAARLHAPQERSSPVPADRPITANPELGLREIPLVGLRLFRRNDSLPDASDHFHPSSRPKARSSLSEHGRSRKGCETSLFADEAQASR